MAKSVAWPFPVKESEPYKSTCIRVTLGTIFSARSSERKRSAARQGPSVCELDGPTPILSISKTEIHSSILSVLCSLSKYKLMNAKNVIFRV
jgi:hypothetical protein